jgi:GAF domain-containing protein
VEPLQETSETLRALTLQGEASLGTELHAMASRVKALVPDLLGLSLGLPREGVTLTLVASAEELAALDAVQYLDGGPCVAALGGSKPIEESIDDLLDEERWQLYAEASSAAGVASSLSMPIMSGGGVIGGVNLYASTRDAFTGLHDAIAEAVGSDAELAVANADLSFETRQHAMATPRLIREGDDINIALGIISARQNVDISAARDRLRDAAAQAGITVAQAARALRHVRP